MKVAQNEKRKKLLGFSFYVNIGNFEAFLWNLNLSVNIYFVRVLSRQKNSCFLLYLLQVSTCLFLTDHSPHQLPKKKKNYKKLTKFSIKVYTRYGTFLGMIFPVSFALLWSNACLKKCNTSEISGNFSVTYLAKIDLSEESVSLNRTCNFSNPSKASQRYPT